MSESNELKVGASGTAGGFTESYNFDWTFGSNQSWGGSHVTNNTTQNSTKLAYNFSAGNLSYPYNVNPLLYYASNGAIKIAYSVNIPSALNTISGCGPGDNWTNFYKLPDPGLVLPFRIDWGTNSGDDVWTLNGDNFREEMKSFFIQSPTLDTIDQVYPALTTNPNPGDTVRLSVAVYNYSVGTNVGDNNDPITVSFSYIPLSSTADPDAGGNNEQACTVDQTKSNWVCPDSDRTPMVDASNNPLRYTISKLPRWNPDINNPNWTMATVNWPIPKTLAAGKYRIYVNLSYTGTETNPPQAACTTSSDSNTGCANLCTTATCSTPTLPDPLAPGQNNEGYAYITVGGGAATSDSATPGIAVPVAGSPAVDVKTASDSFVAVGRNRAWKRLATGYEGQGLKLRVRAIANAPEQRYHPVVVTEQVKSKTGAKSLHVARKILQGTGPQGATAHFRWIPHSIGFHQLAAEVKEAPDDGQKGNNTANLKVAVLRTPGDVNGSGAVDAADLRIIEHENGKLVLASSCGYACDLNGDGRIDRRDLELGSILCGPSACTATDAHRFRPRKIDFDALQDVNEAELKMLRQFKSDDWEELFEETEAQVLPRAQLAYLRAVRRLAASAPSRPHRGPEHGPDHRPDHGPERARNW
jgi:hypothetical protein